MKKSVKAARLAQALYGFARQMDQMESEYVGRDPEKTGRFPTRYTFWFVQGPRNFKNTTEIRDLAKKIVGSVK